MDTGELILSSVQADPGDAWNPKERFRMVMEMNKRLRGEVGRRPQVEAPRTGVTPGRADTQEEINVNVKAVEAMEKDAKERQSIP